ncbi:hypothetical protein DM02DRAFT_31927 [Periconia macrospinosa]|uniref:Uncharacterized protein n=1 Tax=Periconia macrospinosa TaxID=97972 RepID=A0A2V1DNB6_9PLEO|nr:hypothetical protein DM02DRAFT_31927 [Periconia macrospinosa]
MVFCDFPSGYQYPAQTPRPVVVMEANPDGTVMARLHGSQRFTRRCQTSRALDAKCISSPAHSLVYPCMHGIASQASEAVRQSASQPMAGSFAVLLCVIFHAGNISGAVWLIHQTKR